MDEGGDGRRRPLGARARPEVPDGAARFIGHSRSAGRVIVVIAYRDLDGDLHGVNAWPATGADLKMYEQGDDDG
jgi:hypothetical protein